MSHAMVVAVPCAVAVRSAAKRPRQRQRLSSNTPKKNRLPTTTPTLGFSTQKNDPIWQCVQGCGACCKLLKGPTFLSPEEIFQDPSDVQLYRSLIAPDGWCKHYQKSTRTCSIYSERPYFCRVEPDIFQDLYGIDKKKFNKEACCCCVDTIKDVYGSQSQELDDFNHAIRGTSAKPQRASIILKFGYCSSRLSAALRSS